MSKFDHQQTIYVTSFNKIDGTDSNFTASINLDSSVTYDRVVVLNCTIPKSYYSISTGFNFFTLTELGQSLIVTIPEANYNRTSLGVVLASKLNATSALMGHNWHYAVTTPNQAAQGDSGHYIFTVSSNTGQPTFTFNDTTLINEDMGFARSTSYTFSANVLESVNVCNLQPFNNIFVHCNLIQNATGSGVNTDVMLSLPANVGTVPFSNIGYLCPDAEAFSHKISGNSNIISISLTDEDGVPINLHGVACQFTLMFYKKNRTWELMETFIKYATTLLSKARQTFFRDFDQDPTMQQTPQQPAKIADEIAKELEKKYATDQYQYVQDVRDELEQEYQDELEQKYQDEQNEYGNEYQDQYQDEYQE